MGKKIDNKRKITAEQLVRKFENSIKGIIVEQFNYSNMDLKIFLDKKSIYFDEFNKNLLCCMVVTKDGYLFLVTADVNFENEDLNNYRCLEIG